MQFDAIVYVVDDDEAVRDSMRLLMKSADLRTELYDSAQAFLTAYEPSRPGCLVVDVRMPGMNGLELQEALTARGVRLPVIVMTGHGDVAMAVQAMKAGARDFVEKPYDDEILLARIEECLRAEEQAQRQDVESAALSHRVSLLTPRERQVMDLLSAGKPNKLIARELDISTRTVEVHRARIMEKLEAKSLADVVRISLIPS